MKNLLLLTSVKMTRENCIESFKNIRKNIIENSNGISFGKPPKSLYLWFSDERAFDSVNEIPLEDKYKNVIPIDNPYCATIDYHQSKIAKEIIRELLKTFNDLYVFVDEDPEWVGPASDYLNKEFDF